MLIKALPQKLDSTAIITARFSRGTQETHLGESVRQNQKSSIARVSETRFLGWLADRARLRNRVFLQSFMGRRKLSDKPGFGEGRPIALQLRNRVF